MNIPPSLFFIFSLLTLLSGCATILNNSSQTVAIRTSNSLATSATINDPNSEPYNLAVPTLIQARPSSFRPLQITLNDPCFRPYTLDVDQSIKPVYWANFFTYFIGFPVDYLTGHMWEYDSSVNMHLEPNENNSEECIKKQFSATRAYKFKTPEKNWQPHRFSFGLLTSLPSPVRNTDNLNDFGLFLGYTYRLNSQMMANIKSQFSTSNQSYEYQCSRFGQLCFDDISTTQASFSFSLQQYIDENTNFYAGIGTAITFIEQDIIDYDHFLDDNSHRNQVRANNMFLEIGWLPRNSKSNFLINATLDFADIRLNSTNIKYFNTRTASDINGLTNLKANALLNQATIISNASIGFSLSF